MLKKSILCGALALMLLACAFVGTASAFLALTENYSSGLANWTTHGGCYTYSFTTPTDPCGAAGNLVLRVRNIMGQDNRNCTGSFGEQSVDADTGQLAYRHRAELLPKITSARACYQNDIWVGQRIYFPAAFPATQPADRMNISQIIPVFTGQDGTDFKFYIDENQTLEVEIRTGANTRQYYNLGGITRGTWQNWTIHYKRSLGADGLVQIWKNGTLVVNYVGVTTYATDHNGQWKHGIYLHAASNTLTYDVFFDDVKVAQGVNQYDIVQPGKAPGACE